MYVPKAYLRPTSRLKCACRSQLLRLCIFQRLQRSATRDEMVDDWRVDSTTCHSSVFKRSQESTISFEDMAALCQGIIAIAMHIDLSSVESTHEQPRLRCLLPCSPPFRSVRCRLRYITEACLTVSASPIPASCFPSFRRFS